MEENLKSIDALISYYQAKADEVKTAMEAAIDGDTTVSTYKWMHSLWRTLCSFVSDLDVLASHCEIGDYVESCTECGFCNNKKEGE